MSKIINVFDQDKDKCWKNLLNNYDCILYPDDSIKYSLRINFDIPNNEHILFMRDTSTWNDRNEGIVITDYCIRCITNNDNPDKIHIIRWDNISTVYYQDLIINFNMIDGSDDGIHVSRFFKTMYQPRTKSGFGKTLAKLFTKMAQSVEKYVDPKKEAREKYKSLIDGGQTAEAMKFAEECMRKKWCGYELSFMVNLAGLLYDQHDYEKAILYCDECVFHIHDESYEKTEVNVEGILNKIVYYRYLCYKESNQLRNARVDAAFLVYKDYDKKMKFEYVNNLSNIETDFRDSILSMPYNERKVIMPVKEYVDELNQQSIMILKSEYLPKQIEFTYGYPKINEIYIGHPYLPNKYMPIENYELELVEDRVREFCHIMQSLGATEITIDCANSTSTDMDTRVNQHVDGGGSAMKNTGAIEIGGSRSSRLLDDLSKHLSLHQTFSPKKVILPDNLNLVWYKKEPSWQRLVSQRIDSGSLLEHEEKIETKKSRVIEGNEMMNIKSEFDGWISKVNTNYTKNIDKKFTLQDNAILSIHVKFAPLESLEVIKSGQQTENVTSKENEQAYREEVLFCLQDDGIIDEDERLYLNGLRIKYEISEKRAIELEIECFSSTLNDNEMKYLETYKDMLKNKNVSRKILERKRVQLAMTENRVQEIENMANNSFVSSVN